ncbi:MAG: hypothetical protein M3112_06085 [Actinomycetia bacterium]|nr:hypothetical protein [Actinomycetes bacterium]
MKRLTILIATVALFASMATIAFADDHVETDAEAEVSEPEDFNEAEVQKLDALAGFLRADFYVGEKLMEDNQEAAVDQIIGLRTGEYATGWGAIFKLLQLAKASERSLDELMKEIAEDGGGWAFGRRFKDIPDPAEPADDAPRNFGQLKKQEREENGSHGKKPKRP